MLCWASRPLCNTFVPSQDLASMSQPFPYPPSFSSLYLLLVVLLQVLLLSEAYSGGPRDPGLRMRGCTTLSVGHHGNKLHSNTTHAEQTRTPKVEARLLDGFTHNPVDCYTPGAKHLGECLSRPFESSSLVLVVCIRSLHSLLFTLFVKLSRSF